MAMVLMGWLSDGLAAPSLTIVSWGGAYERSQREAYFEPFTAATGIEIEVKRYNGGVEELRKQVNSGNVTWDLVDLVMSDNLLACDEGLLEPIDHSKLAPSPEGIAASEDFFAGALSRCGVSQVIYSTVLAYDTRAFPGVKPGSVKDLFDLERFPGKRALQRQPIAILEWALRSYGVPRQDIYNLLSTDRGLDLAFRRLDTIKDQIIWWQDGAVPPQLLMDQQVVIASGYNGRFYDATLNEYAPIQTMWDGQLLEYSTWGIPRNGSNTELVRRFIRFATATAQLARQAQFIAYGPARESSMSVISLDQNGRDIRPYLPTYPSNLTRSIAKDYEWYARMQQRLEQRFSAWLKQ